MRSAVNKDANATAEFAGATGADGLGVGEAVTEGEAEGTRDEEQSTQTFRIAHRRTKGSNSDASSRSERRDTELRAKADEDGEEDGGEVDGLGEGEGRGGDDGGDVVVTSDWMKGRTAGGMGRSLSDVDRVEFEESDDEVAALGV